MIHDKYNPMQGIKKLDPAPEIPEPKSNGKPALQSWQDSGPIVRLLEYLKTHEDKGVKMILKEGRACLRFEPGLGGKDRGTERWQVAVNTLQLLQEADEDLGYLITKGLIELPANGAGPS